MLLLLPQIFLEKWAVRSLDEPEESLLEGLLHHDVNVLDFLISLRMIADDLDTQSVHGRAEVVVGSLHTEEEYMKRKYFFKCSIDITNIFVDIFKE